MFRTALRLARHRDLVASGGPDATERRRSFATEIDNYRARIGRIAQLAEQRQQT
jgi:glycerol-3-phosphate O-acyltransferase